MLLVVCTQSLMSLKNDSLIFWLVAGITQKFHRCKIDVIDTYQNVNTCLEDIQLLRYVDQESDAIFKQVVWMTDQLNVESNTLRVAKKFIEIIHQLIHSKSTTNELLSYWLLTHCFNKFSWKGAKLLILCSLDFHQFYVL